MARRPKRNLLDDYRRVTEECPCPICDRPDWCLIHNGGLVCICSRVKSKDKRGEAGWYHKIKGATKKLPPPTVKEYLSVAKVAGYLHSLPPATEMLARQAELLGLSLDSVVQFYARYDAEKAVVAFPMLDDKRRPVGVRFRRADSRKWALKGGKEGVFISRSFRPDKPVFVAEGPSDAATLVDSGLTNVLGRPSCSGGTAIIKSLMKSYRQTPVIIMADPGPPGETGAADLANALPNPSIVILGPTDLRDYYISIRRNLKKLTPTIKQCILEAVDSDERTTFLTIHRNLPGRVYDFKRAIT